MSIHKILFNRFVFGVVLCVAVLCMTGISVFAQETEPEAEAAPAAEAAEEAQEAAAEAAPAEPQLGAAQRVFRNSSKVVVTGRAEANGVLTMIFEPHGGEAKKIRVNVVAKTNAKKIGKDVANQLAFTVGSDYKVKGNGAKVTVKAKNKKVAPFWIGIEHQALSGVAVMVTKG